MLRTNRHTLERRSSCPDIWLLGKITHELAIGSLLPSHSSSTSAVTPRDNLASLGGTVMGVRAIVEGARTGTQDKCTSDEFSRFPIHPRVQLVQRATIPNALAAPTMTMAIAPAALWGHCVMHHHQLLSL